MYQYRRQTIWTFTLKYCSFLSEKIFLSFYYIVFFWACSYEYRACICLYHRWQNQLVCSSLNENIQFLLRLRGLWAPSLYIYPPDQNKRNILLLLLFLSTIFVLLVHECMKWFFNFLNETSFYEAKICRIYVSIKDASVA